ncbi:MAG: VWA domain-containing protein [Acidobacteriota bacterium]
MKRILFVLTLAAFTLAGASAMFGVRAQMNGESSAPRERGAGPTPTPSSTPVLLKEDDSVYTVDTELVNINVRVVDRNSRPISNLTKADFRILEDNAPQQIEFFSKSEVPTNYSLVIDNSGSLRQQIDKVIEASKILVANNRAADETSVIRFVSSEKIEIIQDFTANKTDLNDALDNLFIEGGQTAIIDAVYLAATRVGEYEKDTDKVDRKRRALILVSDGEDVNSYYSQQQLFEMLKETDVQIYVVGFIDDLPKENSFIKKSSQAKAKAFLEKLASSTGGRAYFPKAVTELNGIAKDIADELRVQYSIGYIPSNDAADGTFRNIKVSVADGPNAQKRIAITKSGRTADSSPGAAKTAPARKLQ